MCAQKLRWDSVSFQAIESLVEKVVSQFNGIRDVKPRIIAVPRVWVFRSGLLLP